MSEGPRQRIDKWLFFARAVKSRSLAAKLAQGGQVRVNGIKIDAASRLVGPGDVLTIALERRIAVWRILGCGERRGPAPEAQALYEDISPPPPERAGPLDAAPSPVRGEGRPTKKQRRALQRLTGAHTGFAEEPDS